MAQNPVAALPKSDVVRALRAAGSRTVSEESLEADIAAGLPVNDDGTISLVDYAAWIIKEDMSNAG